MKNPTIIDVAKLAGVSWKTVSRVVNREAGVKPGTSERVDQAIRTLGYRPNLAARSLGAERPFLIGALTGDARMHYTLALSRGAAGICRARGFHLSLEELDLHAADVASAFEEMVRTGGFHGIIVPPPMCNMPELLDVLRRYGVRFVRLDPMDQSPVSPYITVDDAVGVDALVDHAVGLGHRGFAIVEGPADHRAAAARKRAFVDGVRRCLATEASVLEVPGNFTFAAGLDAGPALFDRRDRPTFVFAANDDMAAGVIAAAGRHGVRVPDDISVAGFDDSDVAQLVWPPLTTIHQPIDAIAAAAVEMLTDRAGWSDDAVYACAVRLVIRQSTGPARG